MVDKQTACELYSHAAVFCCPSIYEPFGIINLEAMACETAVVASAVGGIKEVVVDGETGFLVPLEQMKESPFEPLDPEKFSRDLAARINQLMKDPALREKFGKAGRKRAEEEVQLVEDRAANERALRARLPRLIFRASFSTDVSGHLCYRLGVKAEPITGIRRRARILSFLSRSGRRDARALRALRPDCPHRPGFSRTTEQTAPAHRGPRV